jgi:salicylate hydroxylase
MGNRTIMPNAGWRNKQGHRMTDRRVAVVGAGIGGLATAAALLQQGFDVRLYERANELTEIGAGIQLTPNAVKVIIALGGGAGLEEHGFRPHGITALDWRSARVVFRKPLIEICRERYGADYIHIHRADLHRILRGLVPQDRIELGTGCTALDAESGVLTLADQRHATAAAVIGADGIHSTVRAALFGAQPASFTGHVCWRSTVPIDGPQPDLALPETTIWLGPNGHVVTYYVHAGRAINVIAILEAPDWVEESWTTPSSREAMIAAFEGWHPRLHRLFAMAPTVFKWGLFDRDPLPQWTRGRATLLGDAAHPMLPYLSQGAGMAIEDGYVLARLLARGDAPQEALQTYERMRRPRTSRVQLASRATGQTFHLASPWARLRRDVKFAVRNFTSRDKGFETDWLYAHDVTREALPPMAAAA